VKRRPRRSRGRLLARIPRWQTAGLCLGLIAILGVADYFAAQERFLTLLYLLPVFLGAWYVGRSFGLALAITCTATALVARWPQAHAADLVGEAGILAAVALLASRVKEQHASERAARLIIEGIINAIPARVFWKGRDLVYLGCNAAFARDAGFADPQDVIGKDDYQMGWRDQAELYRADDRQVIESGRSKSLIEEPQTTPEGNALVLLTTKVPLHGSEGEVVGVLGTYLDITERRKAEEALRVSEVRYRRLFESATDGILILDAQTGVVLDVNSSLVELLGFSREMLLGKTIWDLGFFKDIVADRGRFAESQMKGYVRHDDTALEASDGRRIDVEFVSNVYLVNHTRVMQCNIRDITERKRAQESSVRLATAVEQSAEAIVITDANGSILYTNPAFEKTTGYTCAEAVGQNPRILKSGKQDDEFYRQMWTVLAAGGVWSGHLINKRKDGTLFEESATISPVRDPAGRIVNYVAVKRDVSNEIRLEQQLFQAQKMEAVGRLAGGVAHDFNNLLGVITGYGGIVYRRLAGEDPLKGKVEQILKAADRAAGLTRQLLAFSRKQVLQPEILDLNAVVSDMDKMLRRLIGEDVEFTTRLDPHLGSVRADPGQIEQIMMNLAVNARDAMPDGGRLTIETRNADLDADYAATHPPTRTGAYVALVVTDTGSGMDAATQARIFEPFFTTKEAGKGTGLGLATVYGIVKQSEGYIWVYSEVGVGTTFKIYLPRIDEQAALARRQEPGPLPRGSETVLLVEDEASLRQLLREVLEVNGYSVLVARDGAEVLKIAQAHAGTIHIMVTDVIMPGVSGPRIVDLIAPTRPEMKVLFISGYSDESVTRHGLVGPGRAFLSKPFGPEVLLRKVRESLDAP
jgi:two-component system cell cycle sensor histidine kinase/response regulator CckA